MEQGVSLEVKVAEVLRHPNLTNSILFLSYLLKTNWSWESMWVTEEYEQGEFYWMLQKKARSQEVWGKKKWVIPKIELGS